MNIAEFYWPSALFGGALVGLAATIMMATIGRVAGISGIFGAILRPGSALAWQWAFIAGLVLSGLLVHWLYRPLPVVIENHSLLLIVAGLLVGFGTRLGSGCTSGHGVCGVARFSPRSLVATLVFVGTGAFTVFVLRMLS